MFYKLFFVNYVQLRLYVCSGKIWCKISCDFPRFICWNQTQFPTAFKYWHYNLCQCYFEENKSYLYSYLLRCCKIPKGYSSIISETSILLKLNRLSTIPAQLRIASRSRKCQKMIEQKQRVQQLRRFDVETTQKKPLGELINVLSFLKVESTSKYPRRIGVIISTWIHLSKSM